MKQITTLREYQRGEKLYFDVRFSDKTRSRKSVKAQEFENVAQKLTFASRIFATPLSDELLQIVKKIENSSLNVSVGDRSNDEHNSGLLNFQKLFEIYINEKQDLKDSTKYRYKITTKELVRVFGLRDIRQIESWEFKDFLDSKQSTYALNLLSAINAFIRVANNEYGLRLKTIKWKSQAAQNDDEIIKALSLDELKGLLSVIDDVEFKNYVAFACSTGMRIGELQGLKFSDVNFEKESISVLRQINSLGQITSTKTNQSRKITMLEAAKNALLNIQKMQLSNAPLDKRRKLRANAGYIFTYTRKQLAFRWNFYLAKAGLELRNLYNTRHTFATLMIMHNENVLWVAKMMGHSDTNMIYKHYFSYMQDDRKHGEFLKI